MGGELRDMYSTKRRAEKHVIGRTAQEKRNGFLKSIGLSASKSLRSQVALPAVKLLALVQPYSVVGEASPVKAQRHQVALTHERLSVCRRVVPQGTWMASERLPAPFVCIR